MCAARTVLESEVLKAISEANFRKDPSAPFMDQAYSVYMSIKRMNRKLKLKSDDVQTLSEKYMVMHEWLSSVSPTAHSITSIHYNLCMATIIRQGNNSRAIRRILRELESFQSFGTFLGSELGYGINLVNLQTKAVFNPEKQTFTINTDGVENKKFLPNTGHEKIPKIAVVLARLISNDEDCGVFPFIVRIRGKNGKPEKGIKITALGEKPGYPLDNAVTSFTNVEVSRDMALLGDNSFLDEDGSFHSQNHSIRSRFLQSIDLINGGKVCLGAGSVRAATIFPKIVYQYAKNKKSFAPGEQDKPLIEFTNVQNAILSSLGVAFSMEAINDKALEQYRSKLNKLDQEKTQACNSAKYYISDHGLQLSIALREKIGSQGLFCDNKIADGIITSAGLCTAEGDNEVLKIKTAKDLLIALPNRALLPNIPSIRSQKLDTLSDCIKVIENDLETEKVAMKRAMILKKLKGESTFAIYNDQVISLIELGRMYGCSQALTAMHSRSGSNMAAISKRDYVNLGHLAAIEYLESRLAQLLTKSIISKRTAQSIKDIKSSLINTLAPRLPTIFDKIEAPNNLLRIPLLEESLAAAYENC